MQEEIAFGVWLRKQRRALDLTRQTFADQVGCAEVTIRRIEGGTLQPSKELADIILEKLGIPEPERSQWIQFARGKTDLPGHSSPLVNKRTTNLPAPLTNFIGREQEQAKVLSLTTKHRLVTLTGSGGVGKTRLSLKVGERVLNDYTDGVHLVEFAPVMDPLLVPRITALAVGLRDESQRPMIDLLSDYLRDKKMLIILDNCEHLIDACAHLTDTLLKRCPDLKILVTSRESLGILGEAVYCVPSLKLPDIQEKLENLIGCESVRLFEDRAQLAKTDFFLTLGNASAIAEICCYLDGIPLAIELAAARVSSFSPAQIMTLLQRSFGLLTVGNRSALPRHQTLRAATDWSYDLLSPAEQILFQRLSVFVKGWTLEAAQSVCSDVNLGFEAIPGLLGQLIKKSLVVVQEEHGKNRYRMLETIRQYANDKLLEAGESERLRDKHLKHFLDLAMTAEPHLTRSEQLEWLPVLDAEYDNLRYAFEWSMSNELLEASLSFSRALGWFWIFRCYWLEGLSFVKRALGKSSQIETVGERVACVGALYTCAQLQWQLGNFEQILPLAQSSLSLALNVSDERDVAIAKFYLGIGLMRHGDDYARAISLLKESFTELQTLNEAFWQAYTFPYHGEFLIGDDVLKHREKVIRSLELARASGDRLTLANALSLYADLLLRSSNFPESKKNAEESIMLYKQLGFSSPSINSFVLADIAWVEGDTPKAKSLYEYMRDRYNLLGEKAWRSFCATWLGLLAMDDGNLKEARTYLDEALNLSREIGSMAFIAQHLIELSHLFFLQGDMQEFKRYFMEGYSLKKYFTEARKPYLLMTILGFLYVQNPEGSVRLLGAIDAYERDGYFTPLEKRYYQKSMTYARTVLAEAEFDTLFVEGNKMSLDDGLEYVMKIVEEM